MQTRSIRGERGVSLRHRAVLGGVLAVVVLAAGCNDSTGPGAEDEVLGPAVAVGNGTARTFVVSDADGPVSIGIRLDEAALASLPSTGTEWQLAFPAGVSLAPWDHATLDWNPNGHPPPGVYDVPHFDFHFYIITPQEQQAIAGGPDDVPVPEQYRPQDYVPDPVGVPAMGVHWTDPTAPEFNGQPFDRTFIYGFHAGHMAFAEPMVTLSYLQSHPEVTAEVKQPQAFEKPGLYPRGYSVRYDPATATVRVALDSLIAR